MEPFVCESDQHLASFIYILLDRLISSTFVKPMHLKLLFLFQSLKTPSNLLVVNLAFSDFLMMCAMSPAMVVNCYNETWVWGKSLFSNKYKYSIYYCFLTTLLHFRQVLLHVNSMLARALYLDVHRYGP